MTISNDRSSYFFHPDPCVISPETRREHLSNELYLTAKQGQKALEKYLIAHGNHFAESLIRYCIVKTVQLGDSDATVTLCKCFPDYRLLAFLKAVVCGYPAIVLTLVEQLIKQYPFNDKRTEVLLVEKLRDVYVECAADGYFDIVKLFKENLTHQCSSCKQMLFDFLRERLPSPPCSIIDLVMLARL